MFDNLLALFEDFFFIGLPYISILLLFGGTLYRLFLGLKVPSERWIGPLGAIFYGPPDLRAFLVVHP
jgi:hypothetical protein